MDCACSNLLASFVRTTSVQCRRGPRHGARSPVVVPSRSKRGHRRAAGGPRAGVTSTWCGSWLDDGLTSGLRDACDRFSSPRSAVRLGARAVPRPAGSHASVRLLLERGGRSQRGPPTSVATSPRPVRPPTTCGPSWKRWVAPPRRSSTARTRDRRCVSACRSTRRARSDAAGPGGELSPGHARTGSRPVSRPDAGSFLVRFRATGRRDSSGRGGRSHGRRGPHDERRAAGWSPGRSAA